MNLEPSLFISTVSSPDLQFTRTRMLLILLIIFSIYLASSILVESQNFSFSSFDSSSCGNGSNLICLGSVSAANGSLTITPGAVQVGRALFRYPILAWPVSFSTTFTISITSPSTVSGDGMAFIIAKDDKPSPPESYGSYIGIMDPSTEGGFLRQLAVEFDSYKNPRDIDRNHIAIDTTSVEYPVAVRSLNDVNIDLKSGRNIRVKIEYDGLKKVLQIHVAYAGDPLINFLNHKIIMEETVPQQAYVGFTGSTGHISETHQIHDWNFTMYGLPYDSLHRSKSILVLHIIVPSLLVLAFAAMLILATARMRRRARAGEERRDIQVLAKNAAGAPKFFTYKQLSKATGAFSKENLLGTGGFGSVYKGVLPNSDTIAVKKINATSEQGEKEYLAEICTIGRLRHKNLVQLLGWCHHDKNQLLLVYEYMPNGSLDRYIGGKEFLDWESRHKILSGLASVLLYLHQECDNPVVHRDVKPNNVMLDSHYNAHLGDFGLARLLQNNAFITTMVAGTIGYLAPEVSYTGRATPESDVYSFGMVVLELVCGRRSKGVMEEFSLVDCVWSLYEKGELISCVDRALKGRFDEEQVRRSLIVGLACLQPHQMERPNMRKVVQIFLNPDEPLINLPCSRPTEVCFSLTSSSTDLDCSGVHASSPNEMTIQYHESYTK